MSNETYPIPSGVYAIPENRLDLRSDEDVDESILNPPPITSAKNIWFFWHQGYIYMHPYTKRIVRAWHRRFSKQGWTIRVLDRRSDSSLNITNFLDINDVTLFPKAFVEGTIEGEYALQHTSDLVRWPLLLNYGGVYADVGLMQIGDLDKLWGETIGNPESPYKVLSYNGGGPDVRGLMNYFLGCLPNNEFFDRCHRLLLHLWNADGGKTSTDGMHASPLLKGLPLMAEALEINDERDVMKTKDIGTMLTDYIIQGQVITMVMGLVDDSESWNGPAYCAKHIYAIEFMEGSQLINAMAAWNGPLQFELMSQHLPTADQTEDEKQKQAREIIEACLTRSFGFKLAHGLIIKVSGDTLGSLWRKHEGSDVVEGTYAAWLRYGMIYWCPGKHHERVKFEIIKPFKVGPLLQAV